MEKVPNLTRWQRIWYVRILRLPVVFYPLVWFNDSVLFTRHKLERLIRPPGVRAAQPPPPASGGQLAGVREPRRPTPHLGAAGAAAEPPSR